MIETTLRQLDAWYGEASQGSDRPKLLSKLAVLELCGWLEGEADRLVITAAEGRLPDGDWVRKEVIAEVSGFQYEQHWRRMLVRLVGEVFVLRIEAELAERNPGELERLKSLLGTLWKIRCDFAHADVATNVAAQKTFQAPSWAINQHRILKKLLMQYEESMLAVLDRI